MKILSVESTEMCLRANDSHVRVFTIVDQSDFTDSESMQKDICSGR